MSEAPAFRYVAPNRGQTYLLAGDLVAVKVTAAETGGAYSLFELRIAPTAGLPLHLHRYEDEAVFVLAGTLTLQVADRRFEAETGGYAFVPRSVPHAFTNQGSEPARLLLLVSPGGLRELLIDELGEPVAAGALWNGTGDPTRSPSGDAVARDAEVTQIAAAAEKYGTEFLTPSHRQPND